MLSSEVGYKLLALCLEWVSIVFQVSNEGVPPCTPPPIKARRENVLEGFSVGAATASIRVLQGKLPFAGTSLWQLLSGTRLVMLPSLVQIMDLK